MKDLKDLTWQNHQKAERSNHARKLLKGMQPSEYHRYIYNQYVQYAALETQAQHLGALVGIENICRATAIKTDLEELEHLHNIDRNPNKLCPIVYKYRDYVKQLPDCQHVLAHIYVRHFGDMYGGQMIRKRNPGSGKMYDFQDAQYIKDTVRARLHNEMANEANRCFEFAMQLFEELERE
jgi:heme oxygenase